MTEYCPKHRTPMGLNGCGPCRHAPIPMPQWFKDQLVALGLREPPASVTETRHNPNTDTTDTDRASDHD